MRLFAWKLGPAFGYLQAATVCSNCAGVLTTMLLSWWSLKITHSAVIFGSMMAFGAAIEIYTKPFIAPLADKLPRLKLVLSIQIINTLIYLIIYALYAMQLFAITYVIILLTSLNILMSLSAVTVMSAIPDLVPKHQVSQAIALRATLYTIIQFLSPLLASLVFALGAMEVAFMLLILLNTIAVFLLRQCYVKFGCPKQTSASIKAESWFTQMYKGFRTIFYIKVERDISLVTGLLNFIIYPFIVVTVPYRVTVELDMPISYFALFEASFAFGLVMGSWWLNRIIVESTNRFWALGIALHLIVVGVLFFLLMPYLWLNVLGSSFCGLGMSIVTINTKAVRTLASHADYRARTNASANFIGSFLNPFALSITGLGISNLGSVLYSLIFLGILIVSLYILLFSKNLQRIWSLNEAELEECYVRIYPRAFD